MNITGKTKLTGLLGRPVSHSISPAMHNLAFQKLDLDYVYLCFDVGVEEMPVALEGLRNIGIHGFNCTMPCKNIMAELADELSPAAKLIGAVNTVVNDNGRFIGHNTDGIGFMRATRDAGYDMTNQNVTLLGAGGAATAIAVQAALDGVSNLHIFSIPDQFYPRMEQITARLNEQTNCCVTLDTFDDESVLQDSIANSAFLINGTSVGMAPNIDRSIIHDASMFHQDLIVSDVIYNPSETKLLRMAREAGCRTYNGHYMLLYQGAEAFRIWTGEDMPIELVKRECFA
ncbi:MAG: shikimate dehydrogenase [Lachnospiraceae bacterium]